MSWIMGVDPGLKGALCLTRLLENERSLVAWDIPTSTEVKPGRGRKKKRTTINEEQLAEFICGIGAEYQVKHIYIERVANRPGEGGSSSFNFGTGYGILRGMLTYQFGRESYSLISPAVWKRAMGCGSDKRSSLVRCMEYFGDEYRHLWFGKKMGLLDGRCEAALIGLYGWQQWNMLQRKETS